MFSYDEVDKMLFGENGMPELNVEEVGDDMVALFFALVRNLPDERLHVLFQKCVESANTIDLFVLIFQTRDCRGGKGERTLFFKLFLEMFKTYPQMCLKLLPLIATFGSFKDYFVLLGMTEEKELELHTQIIGLLVRQLLVDAGMFEGKNGPTSLCAKYCPREGGSFEKQHPLSFHALIDALFPEHVSSRRKEYRKLITRLTGDLKVPETYMCANAFSQIDFKSVPSLCMLKNRKAFLNEKLKRPPSSLDEEETGNRFPTNEDRVQARKKLKSQISTIKGSQLYPHQLASKYMDRSVHSESEKAIFQAQWNDIRTKLVESLESKPDSNVGKLIPLVDVSGSMAGTPMEVAVALGILLSEINAPSFRDRILTFSSVPQWVDFSKDDDLESKVRRSMSAYWEMSTNLEKAFDLIEQVIRADRLPMSEVPGLIIFSDMQFDSAVANKSKTQLELIKARFHQLGLDLVGTPYPAPRIVFWNLRGDTQGFPAGATENNVQMLSGFSPSLFQALVNNQPADPVDPIRTLHDVLHNERYLAIRSALEEV